MQLQEINLRSGRVVNRPKRIEDIVEEYTLEMVEEETTPEPTKSSTSRPQEPSSYHIFQPSFPERLEMEIKERKPEFDLVSELRNMCIKIPLLQEIKDISIYAKKMRELCTKKPWRQNKEPSTIQVGGKLASLMPTGFVTGKYVDLIILVVTTFINGYPIKNIFIDLGVATNVITVETLSHIGSFDLLPTPTMLELADRSKVKPEGVLEDIVISLDSWEYLAYFYVLQPKIKLGGHPLILGRPWLATVDADIGHRSRNMTITHGAETKHINLYPPC